MSDLSQPAFTARRGQAAGLSQPIGLLDLGSSKFCCLIVGPAGKDQRAPRTQQHSSDKHGNSGATILASAYTQSAGIRCGAVVDMPAAEAAVRSCVAQAEAEAGLQIRDVHLAINGCNLMARVFAAHADVSGAVVTPQDVARAHQAGRAYAERDGRRLIDFQQIGVKLDSVACDQDPIGLAARRITVELFSVTCDQPTLQNFATLLQRSHLNLAAYTAAPIVSAMAVTSENERDLGITVANIGAQTINVTLFVHGHPLQLASATTGSAILTRDIAVAFETTLAEAERIKSLYGTLARAESDQQTRFDYVSGEGAHQRLETATVAELADVILPGANALLDMTWELIEETGLADAAGRRIVLTGGGAQALGIASHAADRFGLPVRVGVPTVGEADTTPLALPGSSVVAGLINTAARFADPRVSDQHQKRDQSEQFAWRVGRWLMAAR
ncbi:MAG: cell division protein FtsA [Pseudomonadota bacterium]